MRQLDIAVCGCGPAGLTAALLLHREGHRVRIFDRFETPRPLGSGLIIQPTGLGVLRDLALLDQALAVGARIDRLFGRVRPSNRVVLDVRYSALGSGWHGVAMHRAALFDLLHRAARHAGIEICASTEIESVERNDRGVILCAKQGGRLGCFDLIVDALGTHSALARDVVRRAALPYGALWTNVPWPAHTELSATALEQRYWRASRMAGILPIGRHDAKGEPLAAFFWSLKRGEFASWRARSLSSWKGDVEALWPQARAAIEGIVDHDQLVYAQYDHFTARVPYSTGVVHIGDSARSTSPQLGQGANMAMLDALALAKALSASGSLQEQLRRYAQMRYWHAHVFQTASAMFTPFYQSDSRLLPIVRDWLASPLSQLPIGNAILVRLVSGMTVAPIRRSGFNAFRGDSTERATVAG